MTSGSRLNGFQKLCLVTCVVIFGLIVLGGVVRATDSGLGCPDWPRCHGSFIPRWEKHTLIEYSHRLTASIAGLLVLGILVGAWRSYRRVPAVFYPAVAAFALLLFQAGLGGAVVVNELPPEIVAVHLAAALTLLTLLVLITTTTFALQEPLARPRVSRQFGNVALLALVLTFAQMLIGSYVSGAGYGLACSGWPLCNGQLVPTVHATSVEMHFLHRATALALGIVILGLGWLGWRSRREAPIAATFAAIAFAIYIIQVLIGAANIWTQLADELVAAHLAFATLLWVVLAVLNIRVHRLYELLPLTSRSPTPSSLAGVTR